MRKFRFQSGQTITSGRIGLWFQSWSFRASGLKHHRFRAFGLILLEAKHKDILPSWVTVAGSLGEDMGWDALLEHWVQAMCYILFPVADYKLAALGLLG